MKRETLVVGGGAKIAAKIVPHLIAIGLKDSGKIFLKFVPGVSIVLGFIFAYQRWKKHEYKKMFLEVVSGFSALIPGYGTLISIGIDGMLLVHDIHVLATEELGPIPDGPVVIIVNQDPNFINPSFHSTLNFTQASQESQNSQNFTGLLESHSNESLEQLQNVQNLINSSNEQHEEIKEAHDSSPASIISIGLHQEGFKEGSGKLPSICLLGPPDAGKTSLLKILRGEQDQSEVNDIETSFFTKGVLLRDEHKEVEVVVHDTCGSVVLARKSLERLKSKLAEFGDRTKFLLVFNYQDKDDLDKVLFNRLVDTFGSEMLLNSCVVYTHCEAANDHATKEDGFNQFLQGNFGVEKIECFFIDCPSINKDAISIFGKKLMSKWKLGNSVENVQHLQ